MKTFTAYNDPSHGWIKVSLADLHDVDLSSLSFSRFSYYNKGSFYLEEDCDATLFIAAFTAKYGVNPIFKERYSKSPSRIRKYLSLPEVNSFERRCEMINYFNTKCAA